MQLAISFNTLQYHTIPVVCLVSIKGQIQWSAKESWPHVGTLGAQGKLRAAIKGGRETTGWWRPPSNSMSGSMSRWIYVLTDILAQAGRPNPCPSNVYSVPVAIYVIWEHGFQFLGFGWMSFFLTSKSRMRCWGACWGPGEGRWAPGRWCQCCAEHGEKLNTETAPPHCNPSPGTASPTH